jgi:serpin B
VKLLHKALITVDETRTEAAAATVGFMAFGAIESTEPVVFKIDRPFIFLIYDIPTGTILFLGKVLDPSR